jgi:hypothetical protein
MLKIATRTRSCGGIRKNSGAGFTCGRGIAFDCPGSGIRKNSGAGFA